MSDKIKSGSVQALMVKAEVAIRDRDTLAVDVADQYGQILENVAHMSWFKKAVAMGLTESEEEFRHLEGFIK